MSERIFGIFLLLLSAAGVYIGWGLKAPISYEPIGPNAFPVLVFSLLGICALGLIVTRRQPTDWAPPRVMVQIGVLFAVIFAYAWAFDRLGFMLSTMLMTLVVARLFHGSWKQAIIGGVLMSILLYFLFDRLLDVSLPAGLWLKPWLR